MLLLFDINGVLMQHRWDGVSHQVCACAPCPAALPLAVPAVDSMLQLGTS